MKRIKRAKKPKQFLPAESPFEIIKKSYYITLAALLRTGHAFGWSNEYMAWFLESYLSLLDEIGEKRVSCSQFVKDAKDITGCDVVELLDAVLKAIGERNAENV